MAIMMIWWRLVCSLRWLIIKVRRIVIIFEGMVMLTYSTECDLCWVFVLFLFRSTSSKVGKQGVDRRPSDSDSAPSQHDNEIPATPYDAGLLCRPG